MNTEKTGKFIKELREEKKLSQNQLAEKLFVSRTLVNKWESGKITITSSNLKLLSEFFNVSADEILVGERKNDQNKEMIHNIEYKIYDENTKLRSKIKIVLYISVFIAMIFLLYFFVTFYNSVSIYTISTKSKDVTIINGLLIKTRDKIYLRLEPNFSNEEEIKTISLYYKINQKKEIYRSSQVTTISINDFYDLQEYFDFNKFREIKNNLYLEIEFINNPPIEVKLDFKKDYINSNIFINYQKSTNENNDIKFDDKYEEIFKKYNEQFINVKYNNRTYEVVVLENNIIINYDNTRIIYNNINSEKLQKEEFEEEIYLYDISNNICISGDCEYFDNDYDLFKKVIENLVG